MSLEEINWITYELKKKGPRSVFLNVSFLFLYFGE